MKFHFFICFFFIWVNTFAQYYGDFNGNTQLNYQTFQEDDKIDAEKRSPQSNGYTNLLYNYKQFTIGARLEIYRNPIPSLEKYDGSGIANKFIEFQNKIFMLTLGNFYDEFGSGLIFRTYFDPNVGVDNSVNGVRLKYIGFDGLSITILRGKQRTYWDFGSGIISAMNADFLLNNIFFQNWNSYVNLGFSFVTKKEKDTNPEYILPENVGALNGRLNISKGNSSINIDYAYKINDPSSDNNYIYQNGNGLIITSNYSKKGFGLSFGAKRIQNMSFRSERNAILQDLNINYITPFTKQQSYSLATIYPYSSQPNGEMGTQLDIYYTIPKKTKFGGKYGTEINFNFSNVFNIDKSISDDNHEIDESGTIGYNSNFLKIGKDKLFQELNIEIVKKMTRNIKITTTYINLLNNDKILKSQPILENKDHEIITANVLILEGVVKIKSKNGNSAAIKTEIQHLNTKQHFGNWGMGLIEYKFSNWFFSLQDLYNYGHPEKPHYYSVSSGYNKGVTRITFTYGKQRAGLFCVGGVCRDIPASNGFSISLTSSF